MFWKEFNQLFSSPSPSTPCFGLNSKVISNLVVCIDTPEASVIPSFPLIDKLLPELLASFSMVTKPPISFNPSLCLPCSPSPPPSSMGSLVVFFHSPLGLLSLPLSGDSSNVQGTKVHVVRSFLSPYLPFSFSLLLCFGDS